DETEACEHGSKSYWFFVRYSLSQFPLRRRGLRMDAQSKNGGQNGYGYGNGIDAFRAAKERVGDSSDGGAGDGCDLKGTGSPGDCVREMFFGNQLRQQRAARRPVETAEDSEQYENNVNCVNRARSAPVDRQQKRRAQREPGIAPHQQLAAVVEIGRVSGEKEQREAGQKLGKADGSEIERALGDLVHLPSHGDRLHLERYDDEEARERVGDEVGMSEGYSPGKARVFGIGREHSLITLPQNRLPQNRLAGAGYS